MISIAPSILAADFSRLGDEVRLVEQAGAHRIHVDVMDGHFVPNLSMGPVVVKGLRPVTKLPLEVHLMVEQPGRFTPAFFGEGADSIIAHVEVLPDVQSFIEEVRLLGKRVGLAVKPDTPVEALEPFLPFIDLALCMTVFPGFGGQSFLPESPERIRALRNMIDTHGRRCELEVDGGIDHNTARIAVDAGADVLVVGTAIFRNQRGAVAAVRDLLSLGTPIS